MNYSTNFAGTEDPISEGGIWLGGLTVGLDWLDCRKAVGVAYGKRVGGAGPDFTDPTAILTGTWGQNQTVQATVVINVAEANNEIELRLNSALSAHSCTGYEVLFDPQGAITIVRWNGAIGNFTIIGVQTNIGSPLVTGDVIKATNVGGLISGFYNGTLITSTTDTTYTAGAPGFGLNNFLPQTDPTHFGLSAFSATDGLSGNPPYSVPRYKGWC